MYFFLANFRSQQISLPIPSLFGKLLYLIPLYFGFAVIYDIGLTIYSIVKEHEPVAGDQPSSNFTSPIPLTTLVTKAALHNLTDGVTSSLPDISTNQLLTKMLNHSDLS